MIHKKRLTTTQKKTSHDDSQKKSHNDSQKNVYDRILLLKHVILLFLYKNSLTSFQNLYEDFHTFFKFIYRRIFIH